MTGLVRFLWVYEDHDRALALIRGRNVQSVLNAAVLTGRARYSTSGHGWVISLADLPDLEAAAQWLRTPYRNKQVTPQVTAADSRTDEQP